MAGKKYVYSFGGGNSEGSGAMKELLGGKGANLAEMTNIGLRPGLWEKWREAADNGNPVIQLRWEMVQFLPIRIDSR